MWSVLSQTFRDFFEDECPRLAASLAYYTFFSLPALLVVLVYIGGVVLRDQGDAVRERLQSHFEETIGSAGASQLTEILQNASEPKKSASGWAVAGVMLLLGATGALGELQTALNRAWQVEPDPKQGYFRGWLIKRVMSLSLVLAMAVLLMASLAINLLLATFGEWLVMHFDSNLSGPAMAWLHTGVSIAVITLLFAALLRFLPDARIDWGDVWSGALVTALLFWLGQWLLRLYLTWSQPTSAYGAAGSLALVLLWIYYSGMIFFLGAEFTQVLAKRRGKRALPEQGSRRADGE